MFWFNKPLSGSLLLCFAKVIIIEIVKNVVRNQFGHVAACLSSPYVCVQSDTVCMVHSAKWDCVYSVQYKVRLCVQCTVQSETVCTLHSAKWDCVYGAQCKVRLCLRCTVQSETVCMVHSAKLDYVYGAQCKVRLCVQCTVQSETVCTVHSAKWDCVPYTHQ